MAARDAGGGMSNARRRRERRLRSWWRHEAQSVAAALTAARHHSAGSWEEVVTRREERQEGEVLEEYDGLRTQTTPLPGTRPAPLLVVVGSQGAWPGAPRQPGCVVPSAVPPALAAPAAETVDAAALSFLLTQSLAAQQQEKEDKELEADLGRQEKRLMDLVEEERRQGPRQFSRIEKAIFHWFLLKRKGEKRRKRKKRRKRRLPRSPRPLLRGRVRRRQRQWPSRYAGFPGDVSPRAVFLRSRQAQMRCIMAGLDQNDSYVMAGFTGYDAPRAVFLSVAISQVQFLKRLSCPLCATTTALVQTRSSLASSQVQLLDMVFMPVVCNDICPGPRLAESGRFLRCSSWRRLLCPLCATTYARFRRTVYVAIPQVPLLDSVVVPVVCNDICPGQTRSNRGDAAGAVPRQGCGHACRCAATGAGIDVQKTAEFAAVAAHLHGRSHPVVAQSLSPWLFCSGDLRVSPVAVRMAVVMFLFWFHSCCREGDSRAPTVQLLRTSPDVVNIPVVTPRLILWFR